MELYESVHRRSEATLNAIGGRSNEYQQSMF